MSGVIRGTARPAPRLRATLKGLRGGKAMDALLDDCVAIDALAGLLAEAIERNTTPDGRVDMRCVAAAVIAEMRRHPR